jgi:hypothetical protein
MEGNGDGPRGPRKIAPGMMIGGTRPRPRSMFGGPQREPTAEQKAEIEESLRVVRAQALERVARALFFKHAAPTMDAGELEQLATWARDAAAAFAKDAPIEEWGPGEMLGSLA